jgi:hypothetical protein
VDVPLEEERGAGVPEVVEGDLGQPRALEERCEGPLPEVRWVDQPAALARKSNPRSRPYSLPLDRRILAVTLIYVLH